MDNEEKRKIERAFLKRIIAEIDPCWPQGQYERFDDDLLSRKLTELKKELA